MMTVIASWSVQERAVDGNETTAQKTTVLKLYKIKYLDNLSGRNLFDAP
jgi:hypothetical protein